MTTKSLPIRVPPSIPLLPNTSPAVDAGRPGIQYGSSEYRRAGLALFLAGLASFSLIYCVQPLLPAFAQTYGVSPAESSLALSLTTGFLAIAILLAGACSQALGRRGLMFVSMVCAALLNIVAALLPSWNGLLVARALEGLVLGGVPAVAMAWLAEEMDPCHLGKAMGLYVSGTAFGAMIGRVGMGLMTEFTSWQAALCILGAACLACACGFLALLPRSRNFVAKPGINLVFHLRSWHGHLKNPGLWRLYILGFVLTGVFASLFNYAGFRLSMAPYSLGQMEASLIFLTFSFGIVSSTVAGRLADRYGKRMPLVVALLVILAGVTLTLAAGLTLVVTGIALVTTGFFIGHSVVSSQVGPTAGSLKGHATSLYLLFYYMGASVTGSASGWIWQHGGWSAIVAFNVMLVGFGLCAVLAKPVGLRA